MKGAERGREAAQRELLRKPQGGDATSELQDGGGLRAELEGMRQELKGARWRGRGARSQKS